MLTTCILALLAAHAVPGMAAPLAQDPKPPAASAGPALPQSSFRAAQLLYVARTDLPKSAAGLEIPRMHAQRVAPTDKVAEHVDVSFDLEFPTSDPSAWRQMFDAFMKRVDASGARLGDALVPGTPKLEGGVLVLSDLSIAIDASKLAAIRVAGITVRTGMDLSTTIRMAGCHEHVELGNLELAPQAVAKELEGRLERTQVEPSDTNRPYPLLKIYNFGLTLEASTGDACFTDWRVQRRSRATAAQPELWSFVLVVDHIVAPPKPR